MLDQYDKTRKEGVEESIEDTGDEPQWVIQQTRKRRREEEESSLREEEER